MPGTNIDNNIWGKVLTKNNDIVSRKLADELFLVPIRGKIADLQRIFMLNPVAEKIWNEIDGKNSLNEIRDSIVNDFDVKIDRAEADIREFVYELLKAKLVIE